MNVISIKIQSIEDAKKGVAILDNVLMEQIEEAQHLTIGILEKGTVEGQTTLMFLLKLEDGSVKMAQMTNNQFEMLIGAVRGADQRWRS